MSMNVKKMTRLGEPGHRLEKTRRGEPGHPSGRRKGRRRGFTLVEVLIAIAIVVILAGIVAVNVVGTRRNSKVRIARIELDNVKRAIKLFEAAFDRVPNEDEGLEVLWSKDALTIEDEALASTWYKFLEKPLTVDQWGNEWQYVTPSEHGSDLGYDMWSYGPDGEDGNEDDITSWEGSGDDSGLGTPAQLPPPGN